MANERIYIVIWNKLVTWLTPTVLRRNALVQRVGTFQAFVSAVVTPVNDLHSRFLAYRNYINYQLGITPLTCDIQRALNDRFDPEARRITIVKPAKKNAVPLWLKNENKPKKLFKKVEGNPIKLFTKGETAQFTVDFIVKVPVFVIFDINEMTAFVNNYKWQSKTFKIMIF